jgi:hypothetical protein
MITGDFQRKLKKLNPTLEVVMQPGSPNFPGLHYRDENGDFVKICAVAWNGGWINEYSEYDEVGHVTHPGWRRAILSLLKHNIVTKEKVKKYFGQGFFLHQDLSIKVLTKDPIASILEKKNENRESLGREDIAEIAAKIEAKETQAEKAKLEEERWNLKKWAHDGGGPKDRPKGFDLK